ncbi:MAG: DUF349 domain-containing protein [Tannerellaceae bacterium]|nr:DUF349 domain-containing protein [Tannerellaceae bacterium]
MKDTHETNLPVEETGKLEETKVSDIIPENTAEEVPAEEVIVTEDVTENPVPDESSEESVLVNNSKLTKEEILSKLAELLNASAGILRSDVDSLKQAFYKIHKADVDEKKRVFLENGGKEEDFHAPEDKTEAKIKELLNTYKEKRAILHVADEQRKAANYALKLQLIDRMKELTESQDDFNKLYNEFKEIQQRWKEAKPVPQEHANELWKNYQIYSERFYDLVKINHQFRDYDFKKNLEIKTILCNAAEKLEHEPDVVSAYHQMQKLRQQWRETGPVAREIREDLWNRFKAISAAINKRHQEHFEGQKAKEETNLEAKTAICEQVENIDYSALTTLKKWEKKSKEIIALQKKWKHIGYAPKKYNAKIFERFRAACDTYFSRRGEFYRNSKVETDKNLAMKKALCEKAEALKDSSEWREATDKLISMQKEWKTIGEVSPKYSGTLWKQFISACDYFFERKNRHFASPKDSEESNLEAKQVLIKKINTLDEALEYDKAVSLLKEYMNEWNAIGHVPFGEKDRIYDEYHEAVDKQFGRLKIDQNDHHLKTFRNNLNDTASGDKGKGKLYGERDKLMRAYERMKSDLQTYENNIGFLSSSSKGGNSLIKEMERKIEKLKDEMALLIKKIEAIDENLE